MSEEIWKEIPNYPKYEASNLGRIRNKKKQKIIKPVKTKSGYYNVSLGRTINNPPKRVHRLIALTFIPNPNNLPQINHKDENKANNAVDNLEWCDCLYNNHYGSFPEKRGKPQKGTKIMFKGDLEKMVKPENFKEYINLGYQFGRSEKSRKAISMGGKRIKYEKEE